MSDLCYQSARAMLSELEAGRVSADELLSAHLARNALLHERLNAVVAVDIDAARQMARSIDAIRRRKEPLGPLAGIPMTVKDGFDVVNMPAVVGNPEFVGRSKDCRDAAVVGRAREAGAVIWGKTNVPLMLGDIQTCNAVYGTTNNPYDTERVPGGSSGGSATALAAGITPLEIGSDIGGSLRHPANYCGVFSLKPTWGALPQQGHIPPHPDRWFDVDLNVAGPMARSAEDLRLLYGVLRNRPSARRRDARHIRIALWDEEPAFPLAADVRIAVRAAAEALSKQGMHVEIAKPQIDGEELMASYVALVNAVMSPNLPDEVIQFYLEQRAADWSAIQGNGAWAKLAYHRYFSAATYREVMKSLVIRETMRRKLAEFFVEWDVILMPITPIPPFPHVRDRERVFHDRMFEVDGGDEPAMKLIAWISLATFLQAPAIAVPAGQIGGLPVGIQFVGSWGEEDRLFDIAAAAEDILGGFRPPAM